MEEKEGEEEVRMKKGDEKEACEDIRRRKMRGGRGR